ncbi:MAG: hypothetical protein FRC54_05390 [bacterium LCO1.1]|uniref:Uncharacterized protein n=1 Tax=Candidatus Weimeria bifida TaxID=2599074 RepID=A0A6N7J0H1_9FIRM|nr:hypothetical protein [Candidatus Weimeria bifida]
MISETVINQHSYLLVSDQDPDKEEETDCYIMRKTVIQTVSSSMSL